MGIKEHVKNIAAKGADKLAKVASLSPAQLEEIEENRRRYLDEKPDPNDATASEFTARLLAANGIEIFNAYLPQISELYTPIENSVEYDGNFDVSHNIRYFNISKWVTDKKENSLEKLVNVYEVLSNENCNIALIFDRKCSKTNVYLAVVNTDNENNNTNINAYKNRIENAIKGNFPGSILEDENENELPCFNDIIPYSIATASNIPTEKSEKFISQTIEKLIDGNIPGKKSEEYVVILLATPIHDIEERKLRLGEIYSGLMPYSTWQQSYTYHEMNNTGSSATVGVNIGAGVGQQVGQSNGTTNSESESDSDTKTESTSKGESSSVQEGTSEGENINAGVNVNFGKIVGANINTGKYSGRNHGSSFGKSLNETIGKTLGKTVTKGIAKTASTFKSNSLNLNFGANFARSSNVSVSIGKDDGISQTYINYNIKHALDLLEKQMKRYEQSTALGMWDFAAYVISEEADVANNVAHSYVALTQGNESFMSESAINLWRGDLAEGSEYAKEIYSYIKELRHPLFGLNPEVIKRDPTFNVYPSVVNATTALSGKELAYSLNFPQKSIAGLPVIQCAEFGRNVSRYDKNYDENDRIELGHIYHMNHKEKTVVNVSKKSLASHTFITGSTGSGKSNTVYQLLNKNLEQGVKFLVVEPAKGEYKNVYGNREDVNVYGTNPKIMPLLQLNPFSFPKEIHVLEHLDRLVEIFNVCWPMYAAMPAVLKKAIEKAYIDTGWDLVNSTNEYDDNYYPTFSDVARNIKEIIDSSEYDTENKGAYKGSLLTRLESLTNGINGMILNEKEIPSQKLFDENTIIDLSRVGSSETKSLLMGIIVLKLQEYRMTSNGMSEDLKHLTVLEEAHNILKNTMNDISGESGNLTGKSVEMISNAIAEMRTYGEGFVIVDQAPGLLDMSSIRNTNTKIIMRLPDQSDRELVGKAANLNEEQIIELAKLPCGVASIYQNEWIEPVLCKIDKCDTENKKYNYEIHSFDNENKWIEEKLRIVDLLTKGTQLGKENVLSEIKEIVNKLDIHSYSKVLIMKMLINPPSEPRMTKLAFIYSEMFPSVLKVIRESCLTMSDESIWTQNAENELRNYIQGAEIEEQSRRDIVQAIFTHYLFNEINDVTKLQDWQRNGGLI